jgi:hypothetical protein
LLRFAEKSFSGKVFKDTHGLIHLITSNFMNGTNMKWMEMLGFRIMVNARK